MVVMFQGIEGGMKNYMTRNKMMHQVRAQVDDDEIHKMMR
jgi:hypothetical protein